MMNVPSVFDKEGGKGEIVWHLMEIEKRVLKKGTLPMEYVGIPIPKIKVSWRQNKQGKGRSKVKRFKRMDVWCLQSRRQTACGHN